MTKSSRFAGMWFVACCLLHVACSDDKGASPESPDAAVASPGEFCNAYEAACGFGQENTFSDREDCEDDFGDKFDEARRQCALEHLDLASDDPDGHCEAAKGDEVCRSSQ